MLTTPVSGLRYAELTDSPNANTLAGDLALDVDHLVIPKYSSTTARDAANPTPTVGDMCYVAPYYMQYNAQVGGWMTMTGMNKRKVYQGSDQSSNTSTMANTALQFNVGAGKIYMVTGVLEYAMAATPQIKFGWFTPGSNSMVWNLLASGSGQTGVVNTVDTAARGASTPTYGGQPSQANNFGLLNGFYICDANGTVHLQFGQLTTTSGSTNAAILRGVTTGWSFIEVEQLN